MAKTEATETETPESGDAPLIDLNDASIKKLIARAKKRGIITVDELNEALPSDQMSPDQIEDVMSALRLAQDMGLAHYILLGDAAAVIEQANGTVRARGEAVEHLAAFRALAGDGPMPAVRHIKRTQNLAGIALARGR